MTYPYEVWLDDATVRSLPSGEYWNDESEELQKSMLVTRVEDDAWIRYVRHETNLEDSLNEAISVGQEILGRDLAGTVVDMGAGVGWSSAVLANLPAIDRVYALDISQHRLEKVAPIVLQQYGAQPAKVVRTLADMCKTRFLDGSVDIVNLVQAFHHAADPERLLTEIHRILKPEGLLLISGEKPISGASYAKSLFKVNARGFRIVSGFEYLRSKFSKRAISFHAPWFGFRTRTLFPADITKGDRHYRKRDVMQLLKMHGFSANSIRAKNHPEKIIHTSHIFVAQKV